MKTIWFKKKGWVYLPVSVIGYLLWIAVLLFCLSVFVAVDRHSHSVSDTIYGIFPYFVSSFTVLFWFGSNTCEKKANP